MTQVAERAKPVWAGEEQQVSALVFHLGRELRTALDRRLTSHGLTSQQAALILLSRLLHEPNPNKMAERLGTDTAGMTRLIDRLEKKGLIFRKTSPEDRRSIVIVLGPKSKHMLPRLIPAFGHVEDSVLDGFSKQDDGQLSSLLRPLRNHARNPT